MKSMNIARVGNTRIISGIIAVIIIIAIPSCKSKPENETNNKNRIEAPHKENSPSSVQYKEVVNDRYAFSIEIPEDWIASDHSDNGDGFFIRDPASGDAVDMRIYGTHASLMDAEKHAKIQKFRFADGSDGKLFEDPNNFIVEKYKGEDYVVFSVQSGNQEWISSNRALLEKIAKSIKWN